MIGAPDATARPHPWTASRGRGRRQNLVFWLSNANPYWVERLNALADAGTVPFEAWFNGRSDSQRQWSTDAGAFRFPHRFLRTVTLPGPATVAGVGMPARRTFHVAAPLRAFREARPRAVVTFHGDPALAMAAPLTRVFGGRLYFYVEASARVAISGRLRRVAKRAIFAQAKGFLAPGEDAIAYVRSQGAETQPAWPLHHVVALQGLGLQPGSTPARPARGEDACRFLYVGRLAREKGLDVLLAAADQLAAAGRDVRIELAGESLEPDVHRAMIAARPAMSWRPFVPRTELGALMRAADVFVFPSRSDTYGLVVDEAMACGLPVIASDAVGEIPQRVRPGATGTLVPSGDAEALAAAMSQYAGDPQRVSREGLAAAAFMRDRGLDLWVRDVEEFVEALP